MTTTSSTIAEQAIQSLEEVRLLCDELQTIMNTAMSRIKEALARPLGPTVTQIERTNNEMVGLFTAMFAILSLIVKASAQNGFVHPLVVEEARNLLKVIAGYTEDWCDTLQTDAAFVNQCRTSNGETTYDLHRGIFKLAKEACETKLQAAKSALEQHDISLFLAAMTLKFGHVPQSPTPLGPDVVSSPPTSTEPQTPTSKSKRISASEEKPGTSVQTGSRSRAHSASTSRNSTGPPPALVSKQLMSRGLSPTLHPAQVSTSSAGSRPLQKTLVPQTSQEEAPASRHTELEALKSQVIQVIDAVLDGNFFASESALFGLSGQYAQCALDTIQEVMQTSNPDDMRVLRRLLLRLSLHFKKFPRALFLQQIQCNLETRTMGGFSAVYQGKHKGAAIAVKRLQVTGGVSKEEKKETARAFYHECLLWHNLSHDHIVPILGIDRHSFKGELCMVMPWMSHGDVRDTINVLAANHSQDYAYVLAHIHRWIREVASGLVYLHSEEIAHGDLRGHNILIDDAMHARISDFGLAVFADTRSRSFSSVRGGNVRWLAPELMDPTKLLRGASRPTYPGDVYAFACVCIELYDPKELFGDRTDFAVMGLVLDGKRPSYPWFQGRHGMGDGLWAIVSQCWEQDPEQRLNAIELVKKLEYTDFAVSKDSAPDVTVDMTPAPQYFEKRREEKNQRQTRGGNSSDLHSMEKAAVITPNATSPISIQNPSLWSLSHHELAVTVLLIIVAAIIPHLLW